MAWSLPQEAHPLNMRPCQGELTMNYESGHVLVTINKLETVSTFMFREDTQINGS